ncbi:M20/M25/M40 family metallo-hydrolase [Candidatus Falkowbacteria bacterium]|nr:M20/M25/M40 family metallo-hydrolase [Candidatus Falkowbacteria bacterium]
MKNFKEPCQELFLSLVAIDSPAGHEQAVSDFITKKLKSFGITAKTDAYGNIIAKIPGQGAPLMLCAHMDTVEPGRGIEAKIKGDLITSLGDNILGADDKAGIAEIMAAVEYLTRNKVTHRPLEIVFTREEEIGSYGAKNLDYKSLKAKEALVLDRSGGATIIVIAAPFITDLVIDIQGKAAHAGHPEKGIDAIKIAALAIGQARLGRIDEETTANIGVIRGGEIRNGVPERVSILAEVRSHVRSKMNKEVNSIKKIFEKEAKRGQAKISIKATVECDGYKYPLSDPLVKSLGQLWQSLGEVPSFEKVGGASDANELVKHGIKAVTIGYGGMDPHTSRESIRVSDMAKITDLLVRFVLK